MDPLWAVLGALTTIRNAGKLHLGVVLGAAFSGDGL